MWAFKPENKKMLMHCIFLLKSLVFKTVSVPFYDYPDSLGKKPFFDSIILVISFFFVIFADKKCDDRTLITLV